MKFYLCKDAELCVSPFIGTDKDWWRSSVYVQCDPLRFWSLLQKNRMSTPTNHTFSGGLLTSRFLKPLIVKRVL